MITKCLHCGEPVPEQSSAARCRWCRKRLPGRHGLLARIVNWLARRCGGWSNCSLDNVARAEFVFSPDESYVITDGAGRRHHFNNLSEMPADMRQLFENVRGNAVDLNDVNTLRKYHELNGALDDPERADRYVVTNDDGTETTYDDWDDLPLRAREIIERDIPAEPRA